jgi:hypothetical protein
MDEEENEHPRPWKQGHINDLMIFDANDLFIVGCENSEIAALIVRLVNESEG